MGPQGSFNKFGASVVTISSMSGIMRHAQAHFSYNAAKAATVHLTKMMSAEFQKTWIRVNSIAPGYFPSEMTTKDSDENNKSDLPAKDVADKGHVPAMRGGKEEEMGMLLVSSRLESTKRKIVLIGMQLLLAKNEYINGEVIAIDGGVLNSVAGR